MAHLGSLVTPLVDGQLSTARAETAHAHLINCSLCQQAVNAERRARAAAAAVPSASASPELSARLLAISEQDHTAAEYPAQVRHPVRTGVLAATFVSLTLVVLSLYVVGGQRPDVQEPSDILATAHPVADTAPLDSGPEATDMDSQQVLDWLAAGGWVGPQEFPQGMVANTAHVLPGTEQGARILRVDLDHHGEQVTVLEQQAHLDMSKVAALEPVQIGHHEAYLVEEHWWVLQCGELVVAVSSGPDPADAHELIAALPDRGALGAPEPDGVLEQIGAGWRVLTGES